MKVCFTLLLALLLHTVAFGKTYDILAYGAEADGKTINTKAIQKAINACTPGDTVYIQTGRYLTGTVHLKSNITLYISKEGFLIGSSNINDYETYANKPATRYGMLVANTIANVNITGPGTIEANGGAFSASGLPQQIMLFAGCKDVTVQNLSALSIPLNGIEFIDCHNAKAFNLKLKGSLTTPGKGIELYNCTSTLIKGCHIQSGSNAITVSGLSEQVYLNNCSLQSGATAISIHSADSNSVKNVRVSHVNIAQASRGIFLEANHSGSLEGMSFTDIFIQTKQQPRDSSAHGEPVYIAVIHGTDSVKLAAIKNISFNNILCNAESPIRLTGTTESMLQDVSFDDVVLNMQNTAPATAINTSAVNASYVSGLSINNIAINQPQSYPANGIAVSNFKGFKLSNYSVSAVPAGANAHAVLLTDGSMATVDAGDVFKVRVIEPKPVKPAPKTKAKKPSAAKVIARL